MDFLADFDLSVRELRRLITKRTRIVKRVRRMNPPQHIVRRWEALLLDTMFLWQLRKQGRELQIAAWRNKLLEQQTGRAGPRIDAEALRREMELTNEQLEEMAQR